jgi:pilus assembly protein Flp/PilA
MSSFINKLSAFLRDEEGLTTVEYAIAGGLIGLAVIGAFQALGLTVADIITQIEAVLAAAGGPAA